jgi:hypothetical protein
MLQNLGLSLVLIGSLMVILCLTLARLYFSLWVWLAAGLLLTALGLKIIAKKK